MSAKRQNMIRRACSRGWTVWRMARLYRNWPIALLDKLHFLHRRPITYRFWNGVELSVRACTYDSLICKEVWIDKVYSCSPGFSIVDDWVIADVGGHIGIFSIFAATRARNVKVYTFEPSSENFVLLSHNIERNKLSNVTAFNVAIGASDGESNLHLYADGGQNSFLQRSTGLPISDVKIETWSMKTMLNTIASPLNLLKMDIEGMEYEAILSCSLDDLQRIERIALEYHHDDLIRTPHRVSELVDFLRAGGFGVYLHPEREILVAQREPVAQTNEM